MVFFQSENVYPVYIFGKHFSINISIILKFKFELKHSNIFHPYFLLPNIQWTYIYYNPNSLTAYELSALSSKILRGFKSIAV